MALSLTVDGTELNDSDLGVRLHGQIGLGRSGNVQTLTVGGLLTGDDNDDLNDKWETLKDTFTTENQDVRVKVDGDSTSFFEEFYTGKTTGNKSINRIETFVSYDPSRTGTLTTVPFTIVVAVVEDVRAGGSGSGASTEFEGQIDDWNMLTTYSISNRPHRVFTIQFGPIDDDPQNLGAYSTVSNNGGQAQFNFGNDALDGITFEAGMRLNISGTVYNGTYSVSSIAGDSVTVTAAHVSTDTGSGQILTKTDAEEVYDTNRSSILEDVMELDTDGAWNEDNGLVLQGESIETDGNITTVTIEAGWMPKAYDADIRDIDFVIDRTETSEWPSEGEAGAAPITFAASVNITCNMEEVADPRAVWLSVKDAVVADIIEAADAEGTVGPIDEDVSWNDRAGSVAVKLSFLARNTFTFRYSRVTTRQEINDFTSWQDFEGYTYFQEAAEPIDSIVSITITRRGVGRVFGQINPPQASGYVYKLVDTQTSSDSGMERNNVGTIFETVHTKTFRRFKVRRGRGQVTYRSGGEAGTHAGQFGSA